MFELDGLTPSFFMSARNPPVRARAVDLQRPASSAQLAVQHELVALACAEIVVMSRIRILASVLRSRKNSRG